MLLSYVEKLIARRHRGVVNVGITDACRLRDFGVALCYTFGFRRDLLEA